MKKVITGITLMLSTLTVFAEDGGAINMKQLRIEMDKAASRTEIKMACGKSGRKMVEELTATLRPSYQSIDSITPRGLNVEEALDEVTAPLGCKETIINEIKNGKLSTEEVLAAASIAE